MNTKIERLRDSLVRSWHWTRDTVRAHPVKILLAPPLAVVVYVLALVPFTPSIGDIKKAKQEQPTVVLSADGKELATFKRANRDWVKLADVSPVAVKALLDTEDHRFRDHLGIDFKRTLRAAANTLQGDREGGSTITQQLARNLYPEEIGRAPTLTRKIKEAITALKIEAVYSKDEILETYLNSVSFLYNAWGIEMAARTYFDKPAKDLNELEAATLIGMLKGTAYYNPVLNPDRATQRRNTVLAQMVRHGDLTEARYAQLKDQPLKLDFARLPEFNGPAPHMAEYLRRWLHDWADKNDYNIYADGLVVRTTIDSRLQAYAAEAVRKQGELLQAVADVEWSRSANPSYGINPAAYAAQQAKVPAFEYFWNSRKDLVRAFVRESAEFRALRAAGKSDEEALAQLEDDKTFMTALRKQKTMLQAGFLASDPHTGQIRAWVGSRDYNDDKFDHVQQARRQPGSTFKPFVYGAAFEQGASPSETLMDAPVAIQIDRNQVWRPTDVGEGPTNQPMTLREGLARSKNTITAQLMMRVGPSRVAGLARSMGVRQSTLQEVPSLALGTSPVTLKEMVTAFGTIANGGSYIEPTLVTAIEDRSGRVLASFDNVPAQPALSNQAALTLIDVMRDVIEGGTAVGLKSRFGITGDVAGKTGTTQDNTDGWFILMHPQLVAGAWMGFNDNRVSMRSEYWGQGAHNALLVVGDFMQQAIQKKALDGAATFAAPRKPEMAQPMLDRVNDWFNSVFSSPPPNSPEVAATPPAQLDPPVLVAPPTALATPSPAPMGEAPPVASAEPPPLPESLQRVPSFPRPLEPARPAESVSGTQVYRVPETARAGGGSIVIAPPASPPGGTSSMGAPAVRELPPVPRDVPPVLREAQREVPREMPREVPAVASGSPNAPSSDTGAVIQGGAADRGAVSGGVGQATGSPTSN